MKTLTTTVVLAVFILMSLCAMPVYAEDNLLDKIGDWAATRGKKEPEKSLMLAKRKAERAAKRLENELKKQAKKLNKCAS